MDFNYNKIFSRTKPQEVCYYDNKLKTMIHKFKMYATICECGQSEVKPKEKFDWRHGTHK